MQDIASQSELETLRVRVAALEHENRRLASYKSTFKELASQGKVGGGRVYSFDELLALRRSECGPSAPPLVFVHVPKTGGTTINHILMKNFRYRIDSYGRNFFPRYYPDEFVSLVEPPLPDDTRRPVFFTGHVDLANDVFRYMPVRHVIVTVLREPVARMISHYRHHSTLPTSIRDDMLSGRVSIVDFVRRFYPRYLLQHEIFAPQTKETADALQALDRNVSIFGLQERFEEFVVLLGDLLGLPDIVYAPLNSTPQDAAPIEPSHIDELRKVLAKDIAFYDDARELYRKRVAALPPEFSVAVERFKQVRMKAITSRRTDHAWSRFYA